MEICKLIIDSDSAYLSTILFFELPALKKGAKSGHGSKNFVHPQSPIKCAFENPYTRFASKPSLAILAFELSFYHFKSSHIERRGMIFVVYRSTLLAQMNAALSSLTKSSDNRPAPYTIPWKAWNGGHTRWFEIELHTVWTVLGQRLIIGANTTEDKPLHIVDFNRYNIHNARQSATQLDSSDDDGVVLPNGNTLVVVDRPFTIRADHWFSEDISSNLPYLKTVTEHRTFYDRLYADEERVMGVREEVGIFTVWPHKKLSIAVTVSVRMGFYAVFSRT
jgi:hypothetical protein